jgi:hypothetical protein
MHVSVQQSIRHATVFELNKIVGRVAEWLAFLLCIQEVRGSVLDRDRITWLKCSSFSSVPADKGWDVTLNQAMVSVLHIILNSSFTNYPTIRRCIT